MRYTDQIDVVFTAEDLTEITGAVTLLEAKLSGLRALNKTQMRRIAHFGLRNETFSMEAISAGAQHPELIPPGISLAAIERDRVAREVLGPIAQRIQVLNEKLDHSRRLMGADLFGAARAIYKALQEFGGQAGIGELLEQIGRRFKAQGRRGATEPSSTNGTTPG
jgi:hypothetical protein